MNVDVSTVIAFGAAIAGIATTWGAARARIAALEQKLETVRTDQGKRIGALEKTTERLNGRWEVLRLRTRTAPGGMKVEGGDGE
jgi:hypothetical protein